MTLTCPRCRMPLATGTPCPRCALEGALGARPPQRLGPYELLEIIGRGGMGVVHRARQVDVGHVVALKRIRAGELATEEEVHRFVHEARVASRLRHPNIVRIYHVEDDGGRPYFTMELLEGGSLDHHIDRLKGDGPRAAALVAAIARAVHFGHDHGVLHRDLKPANILLDATGRPHVGDFGVAKLHGEELHTATGLVAGTPHYMAPEQSAGGDVTRAADVWSLGAILYEALTGERPFDGRSPVEVMRRILDEEPRRPRAIAPDLDRDLEAICLKCLEKDPARRYGSAAALAEDLERWGRGEAISARPIRAVGRWWRWCRRHPLRTAAILATTVWLTAVGTTAWSILRAQEDVLRRETLANNVDAARAFAGKVLFELRSLANRVQAAASAPAIVRATDSNDCNTHGDACALIEPFRPGFDSLSLLSDVGVALHRCPLPKLEGYACADFGWRDYFVGARRLGAAGQRGAYAGRVIQSEADAEWKFTLSAPVYDEGRFVGVVHGNLGTDSVLGRIKPVPPSSERRMSVVVAPRDNQRACRDCPLPQSYVVVLHPQLRHGPEVPISSSAIDEIARVIAASPSASEQFVLAPDELARGRDDHRDPLDPDHRWIAGFAPVGYTGYVAIVQTRYDAAVEPATMTSERLGVAGLAALSLGAATIVVLVSMNRRRRRAPPRAAEWVKAS